LKLKSKGVRLFVALLALVAVAVTVAVTASARTGKSHAQYVLGVSNTLVGNGWREEMICAVKAQAQASGVVSKVIVANRNGGPAAAHPEFRYTERIRVLRLAGRDAQVSDDLVDRQAGWQLRQQPQFKFPIEGGKAKQPKVAAAPAPSSKAKPKRKSA